MESLQIAHHFCIVNETMYVQLLHVNYIISLIKASIQVISRCISTTKRCWKHPLVTMSSLAYSISEPQMEYMKTHKYLDTFWESSTSTHPLLECWVKFTPEPTEAQAFMGSLASSGLIYLVKILELIGALVCYRFVCSYRLSNLGSHNLYNLLVSSKPRSGRCSIGICLTILWMWTTTEYKQLFLQFRCKPNNKGIL